MIVTDLDQTLLKSDKSISDYTAKILKACKQQGIIIVFATARSECDCKSYTDVINPNAIISNRGALVRIGNNTISRITIDAETTNQILLSCLEQPSIRYITVFTDKGYFVNIPASEHDPNWGKYNPDRYTDFSQGLDCDAYKISVEIFDDVTADIIAASFPAIDVIRFSGEPWFSFGVNSVNKCDGIKQLAANFNIDLKDVAAFGDDFSDVEMLRKCGVGIAVDNAIDAVKDVADHFCDINDRDGVAKWIEQNLL